MSPSHPNQGRVVPLSESFLDRTKNGTGFQSIRFQCFEQSWDEFGVKKSGGVSSGELIWLPFASGFENNSRSQGVIFFWIVALYFHNGVQSAGLLQDLQIDRWAYAAQPFHILWKILLFPKKWPNPPYLFYWYWVKVIPTVYFFSVKRYQKPSPHFLLCSWTIRGSSRTYWSYQSALTSSVTCSRLLSPTGLLVMPFS